MAKVFLTIGDTGLNQIDIDIDYSGWDEDVTTSTPAIKITSILHRLATSKTPRELLDFARESNHA